MPIVEIYFETKRSSQYRLIMHDFPLAASPMDRILSLTMPSFFLDTSPTLWEEVVASERGAPREERRREAMTASAARRPVDMGAGAAGC